jgi:hypothetical protein
MYFLIKVKRGVKNYAHQYRGQCCYVSDAILVVCGNKRF